MYMEQLIPVMIIAGAVLMITNIIRFFQFIGNSKDVLSAGVTLDRVWELISLCLLIFFLVGYLLVAILGDPDMVTAGILFGGSIFVSIVLTLMFRLVRTVKDNCLNIAETLIGVVDARDPNLKGHSRYVRNLTMLLYEHLPQSRKSEINPISLEFASLMHDVGKLGIPEQILNKPAPLSEEEWVIMKNHPRLGREILSPLNSFREILPWIEFHHEFPNGNGYYGLADSEIPYAAKVIAVADVYSAITMRRSYKDVRSHEEAIQIIKEEACTKLDQGIVDILCALPKEALRACIPDSVEA